MNSFEKFSAGLDKLNINTKLQLITSALNQTNTIINFDELDFEEFKALQTALKLQPNNQLTQFVDMDYAVYKELHYDSDFMKLFRKSASDSRKLFNMQALYMLGEIDENTEFISIKRIIKN